MIRIEDCFVFTPRLTPTEAQLFVVATWSEADAEPPLPELAGRLIGPNCEYTRTLPDRIPVAPMRRTDQYPDNQARACARVLEPCFWSPEHPFCYELELELRHGDRVVDMRRITMGLRHLAVTRGELLLNGQTLFVEGVKHFAESSIAELESWHEINCAAFLAEASHKICDRTDRWGPMVFHVLMPRQGEALEQVAQLRTHPSLAMWVLPPGLNGEPLRGFVEAIRQRDPTRPIARLMATNEITDVSEPVEVRLLSIDHPAIRRGLEMPFMVVGRAPAASPGCTPELFREKIDAMRESVGSPRGLVGVML
jgi:hypothetical protein